MKIWLIFMTMIMRKRITRCKNVQPLRKQGLTYMYRKRHVHIFNKMSLVYLTLICNLFHDAQKFDASGCRSKGFSIVLNFLHNILFNSNFETPNFNCILSSKKSPPPPPSNTKYLLNLKKICIRNCLKYQQRVTIKVPKVLK